MPRAILHGEATGLFAALPRCLAEAGFQPATSPPAAVLIDLTTDAQEAVATATAFAAAVPEGQEALVVHILRQHAPGDWPATQHAATLYAFTRHAALAWAPRRIRVNAVGIGISPTLPDQPAAQSGRAAAAAPAAPATPQDVAATILAIWRFPSMTGQLIRLAA